MSDGAIAERGEVELELDGKAYTLRPTLEAMRFVERDLTKLAARDNPAFTGGDAVTMQTIMKRLNGGGGLRLEEMGIIVYHAMVASAKERNDRVMQQVRLDRLTQLIGEAGVLDCLGPVGLLVANWLSGGSKKKEKQSGETEPPSAEITGP